MCKLATVFALFAMFAVCFAAVDGKAFADSAEDDFADSESTKKFASSFAGQSFFPLFICEKCY